MKVSVVIPAYNEEKRIKRCLEALHNQEVPAEEIIVVDNNSTDKTVEIAKQFKVKIVTESKQGIIPTRNKGFNTAQYDIIARCDADTVVSPGWIKRILYDFTNNKDLSAVAGPFYYYDFLPFLKGIIAPLNGFIQIEVNAMRLHAPVMVGLNTILTKKIWEKIRDEVCTDEDYINEDTDLALHIHKYGRIMYDKQLVVATSIRRIYLDPYTYFIGYPIRSNRTIKRHQKDAR